MAKKINKVNQTPKVGESKNRGEDKTKANVFEALSGVEQTESKKMPSYWKDKPEWFKENGWLIENQDQLFVKRLGNAMSQIQMDINIQASGDAPMSATKSCFMGDESAEATRFQYAEATKQIETFTGDDLENAEKVMGKFKEAFKDYLPFLEK